MKVIIDRFEGEYAVCEKENMEMIDIEIKNLPDHAKEGDVLIIENGDIKIDISETKNRKNKIETLIDELWE